MKIENVPSVNATLQDKFSGSGQYCVVSENNVNVTCDTCRQNCMEPNKICPENCHCYW
jgi:hypothetical protein